MNVVLVEPEIPQNTGNIARTCVMTGSVLYLVGKLGFSLEDRYLRRAGLDYWPYLRYYCYDDLPTLQAHFSKSNFYFFTARIKKKIYTEVAYKDGDFLVFGRETSGLPAEILYKHEEACLRIPMVEEVPRSLNLSNAVAVVLYEALRQQGFPGMC